MIIGDRLRAIRESKNLSQGDIEKRTGLFRCYVSRVENGHTIPSLETLEKLARALEMQLYQVLYEPETPSRSLVDGLAAGEWGSSGKSARYFRKLSSCLSRMSTTDRLLVFDFAEKIAKRKRSI
jgi:transcriptional regulator with XRE-family HTH domain